MSTGNDTEVEAEEKSAAAEAVRDAARAFNRAAVDAASLGLRIEASILPVQGMEVRHPTPLLTADVYEVRRF